MKTLPDTPAASGPPATPALAQEQAVDGRVPAAGRALCAGQLLDGGGMAIRRRTEDGSGGAQPANSCLAGCTLPSSSESAEPFCWRPRRGLSAEGAVEIEGGADQRQVGEGLREVALLLTSTADLLGVQAQVVGISEHLLEGQPCFVNSP